MSDATETLLQKRVEELTSENTSLKSENKDRRIKGRSHATELDTLRAQVVTLTTERDALRTKAEAGPTEKDATIADLTGQLRSRDHRDAFAAVGAFDGPLDAKTGKNTKHKLADGVTIDALWQLTSYKAEGETPSAQTIAKTLGDAVTAHPFLFAAVDPAADAATRPIVVPKREAGPGGGTVPTSATLLAAGAGKAGTPAGFIPGRI